MAAPTVSSLGFSGSLRYSPTMRRVRSLQTPSWPTKIFAMALSHQAVVFAIASKNSSDDWSIGAAIQVHDLCCREGADVFGAGSSDHTCSASRQRSVGQKFSRERRIKAAAA